MVAAGEAGSDELYDGEIVVRSRSTAGRKGGGSGTGGDGGRDCLGRPGAHFSRCERFRSVASFRTLVSDRPASRGADRFALRGGSRRSDRSTIDRYIPDPRSSLLHRGSVVAARARALAAYFVHVSAIRGGKCLCATCRIIHAVGDGGNTRGEATTSIASRVVSGVPPTLARENELPPAPSYAIFKFVFLGLGIVRARARDTPA